MSSRKVPVDRLVPWIGHRVSGVFSDGWDDWPFDGVLVGAEFSDPYWYVEVCNVSEECEVCADADREPGDHGAFGFFPSETVSIHF